jgi:putative transposase
MSLENKFKKRGLRRLSFYDYSSPAYYFLTLCSYKRNCLLSEIVDGQSVPFKAGLIVDRHLKNLPNIRSVEVNSFVIMPNHIHIILFLLPTAGSEYAGQRPALPEIVRAFKSFTSYEINKQMGTRGQSVWQRNYYERIVRNERELSRFRHYIEKNPLNWEFDKENPEFRSIIMKSFGRAGL